MAGDRIFYDGSAFDSPDYPARLWALDAASGETVWIAGIDDISFRTSPAVADGTVYVANSSTRICAGDDCSGTTRGREYAVDAESGDRQWIAETETDTRSSPPVAEDAIYVGCNDGLSTVTTDGETAWHVALEGEREHGPYVKFSPAVSEGAVFVGASDGRLRVIESASGD